MVSILKTSIPHLNLNQTNSGSRSASPNPSSRTGDSPALTKAHTEANLTAMVGDKKSSTSLAAIAKRSISATGLSRRTTAQERSASENGRERSSMAVATDVQTSVPSASAPNTATVIAQPAAASGNSGRNSLMSLLHPRASTPAAQVSPAHTSPALPTTGSTFSAQKSSTPLGSITPVSNSAQNTIPSQLEASYISKVALKMHEMVNRIFPAPTGQLLHDPHPACVVYKGRCSARPDRAKDLADIIYSELNQAANDSYLLRTLLRSAILRTLSVFLTRLESQILAATNEPNLLFVPRSLKDVNNLPTPQRFNLDIVKTAWIIKDAMERSCAGPQSQNMPPFVADSLLPWINKLDSVIGRIMNPLVAEIKRTTAGTIGRARLISLERVPSGNTLQSEALNAANTVKVHLSHEMQMLVGTAPIYLQELAAQLEAASKLFKDVLGCGKEADRWLVSCVTHVTWKGMLALSARPFPVDQDFGAGSETANGHNVIVSAGSRSKSTLPLLRTSGKRSPSPPASRVSALAGSRDGLSKLIYDVALFRAITIHFSVGILHRKVSPSIGKDSALKKAETVQQMCDIFDLLPELDADEENMSLTEEAMHEALLALSSFELAIRALRWPEELKLAFLYDDEDSSSSEDSDENQSRLTPSTVFGLSGPGSPASGLMSDKDKIKRPNPMTLLRLPCQTLDRALDTLPPLITFHLLASRLPFHRDHDFKLPHEVWNLSGWEQYAASLTGFSTGETFAEEVGWQMIKELDRIKKTTDEPEGVYEDLLRVAVAAEVGY